MKKVKWALMASGSGTDANAIMAACASGKVNNSEVAVLVSTKPNVGCLDKADKNGVPTEVLDRKVLSGSEFIVKFHKIIRSYGVNAIFYAGNVAVFRPMSGILTLNVHPANTKKHGGKKMYGKAPHRHVLLEIRDQINRGWKSTTDRFFTQITVHEVVEKPDQGKEFGRLKVEIPTRIILQLMSGKVRIGKLAEQLQKHVLPYEWILLPMAVEAAAKKILDEKAETAKLLKKRIVGAKAYCHQFFEQAKILPPEQEVDEICDIGKCD